LIHLQAADKEHRSRCGQENPGETLDGLLPKPVHPVTSRTFGTRKAGKDKRLISRPFCRWRSSLEALKRGLEEALKELRPDPRQQGSGRTLHAFGGNSPFMYPGGGGRSGTGLGEISGSLSSRAAGSKIPGNFSLLKFPGSLLASSYPLFYASSEPPKGVTRA